MDSVRTEQGKSVCAAIGAFLLLAGCGSGAVDSTALQTPQIVTALPVSSDGVIQWDPNTEPVLRLAVAGDLAPESEAGIVWGQQGLALGMFAPTGPAFRLHVDTPGCGFGGRSFTVTATIPGAEVQVVMVTVDMAKYICDGSPWNPE